MKRGLAEPKFKLIPEGEQTIRIAEIDEKDYAKFAKITVTVEDATGASTRINFNFENDDGTPNDIAEGIYARMCRAALNDQTIDECDTNDLLGKFVNVEITHNEGSKGGTFANVTKWLGAGKPFQIAKETPRGASAKGSSNAGAAAAPKKSAADILAEMRARKAAGT